MTFPTSFTPISDELTQRCGIITAAVYGAIWRYAQMQDGACTASYATIARRLGLSRQTVITHVKILLRLGLIVDLTPGARRRPHRYQTVVLDAAQWRM